MKIGTIQFRVIVGPPRATARYAQVRGWAHDECIFVSKYDEIRWGIDPVTIRSITVLPGLDETVSKPINDELEIIKAIWPDMVIVHNPPVLRSAKNNSRG